MSNQSLRRTKTQIGFVIGLVCFLVMVILLVVKYTVAPSIPLWVTLTPLVPIAAMAGATIVGFIFLILCGIVIAFIAGLATAVEWLVDRLLGKNPG